MYSRNSRFAPNCEPMTPFGRHYGNQSQSGSNGNRNMMRRKDIFEETSDFCDDMLGKIQEKYDKGIKIDGDRSRIIVMMKQDLMKMEEKAKRAGIDPEKEIKEGENNAAVKKKILNSIRAAQNLTMLIVNAK